MTIEARGVHYLVYSPTSTWIDTTRQVLSYRPKRNFRLSSETQDWHTSSCQIEVAVSQPGVIKNQQLKTGTRNPPDATEVSTKLWNYFGVKVESPETTGLAEKV